MNYQTFLESFDKKLEAYFDKYNGYIFCEKGCSYCCEQGDYPMSQLELEYLMLGYSSINDETKQKVQQNIKNIQKGGKCPFLIDKSCSVYNYRPIVCRVHGLCYKGIHSVVLPECAINGKNFAKSYKNGYVQIEPIKENLDTPNVLKDFNYGEIRTLYEWIRNK